MSGISDRLGSRLAVGWLVVVPCTLPSWGQEQIKPEPAIRAPLADRSLLLDASVADGSYVAVGDRGHVLVSAEGGSSWQQVDVPTRATLTGVHFQNGELGWAVGHDAAILRTLDGGSTWDLVHWAPDEESPLLDIWFADADNGFAVGAYGSFYRSSDGGATWTYEPISEWDFHLHQVARASDERLFMAAEAGVIYRSDDGGATWIELPSPYEGSFFGVLPLDPEVVLVFGLQGNLFRSEDGGETWQPIETGTTAMLTDGIRLGDGTVVIGGLGGMLLTSSDGGSSFDLHPQPDRRGISALVETGNGDLLMVGEFGVKTSPQASLQR